MTEPQGWTIAITADAEVTRPGQTEQDPEKENNE